MYKYFDDGLMEFVFLLNLDAIFLHLTDIGATLLTIMMEESVWSMVGMLAEKVVGCVSDIQLVSCRFSKKIVSNKHFHSTAPLAFPPYPYPPPIPFYEGAPFPTGMYLNPYGGGPLYYPPILPVDDNKLQGYVKKQM